MIRSATETMISKLSHEGSKTFFDTHDFPWVAGIEAGWKKIREELDLILHCPSNIPNFQDLSPDQAVLTQGEDWKTFFLYGYGHKAEANCKRCPETTRLLSSIPGMKTAMFSILAPHKHIPEHRGPYKGLLRYHLALVVPQSSHCRIRVGDDVRPWVEGKSLIFDDSHPHEAWNDSDLQRVVLFIDFVRPLPFPLSIVNRAVIWRISRTPFVTEAISRIRNAEQIGQGAPAVESSRPGKG
jgi:ornithine lipid ester-linked acyl 2-hydroxylase